MYIYIICIRISMYIMQRKLIVRVLYIYMNRTYICMFLHIIQHKLLMRIYDEHKVSNTSLFFNCAALDVAGTALVCTAAVHLEREKVCVCVWCVGQGGKARGREGGREKGGRERRVD